MDIDSNIINCPACGTEINVSEILYHQVQDKLAKDFEDKKAKSDKEHQQKLKDIEVEKDQLAKDKEAIQQQVDDTVKAKLTEEKTKLEKAIRDNLKEETAEQITSLQKELEVKSGQVKELNKTKAEIEQLKREKDELRDSVTLEKEKEFSDKLEEERIKIKKQVDYASTIKIKEIEKKLVDQEKLAKDKEAIQQQVDDTVKAKLTKEKTKLEKAIRDNLKEETAEQITSLQKELDLKSGQVKELNKTKAEIEQLKREKDELRDSVTLEKEKEFSDKLKEEKINIKKQVDAVSTMKIKELEKQLEDQKILAEEMKRKAEQGSMQLQGEVQELAIEEILSGLFTSDGISGVGKGIKGADVIHRVRNKLGTDCGIILYESKRTKSFSNDWIAKLKTDAVTAKADICIIVTEVLPDGIDRIGQKDGVWICSFNDFKGLVLVLRDSLIKLNDAYSSQTNKGEKVQMLYDYLTGTEFRLQVGAIIEGFTDLQNGYIQEKRAMERIWKQREKQLEKVLLNTNHFIGSIKGIAGSSIPELKQIGSGDNILELE